MRLELSGYLGYNSLRKPPLVMGHEFAGKIISTGLRTDKYKAGDRVTVNPLVSCGKCRDCLAGSAKWNELSERSDPVLSPNM